MGTFTTIQTVASPAVSIPPSSASSSTYIYLNTGLNGTYRWSPAQLPPIRA